MRQAFSFSIDGKIFKKCHIFFSYSPVSPVSTAQMCPYVGVGPSNGTWTTYQGPHPPSRISLPSSETIHHQ